MTLDYYPFGLKQKGYNNVVSSNGNSLAQQWKFGGKQYQEELGLNWYDVTARNYDPAIGRWMNLDPLAEKMRRHSPYNYALNNPVFFIDPDGNMVEMCCDGLLSFVSDYASGVWEQGAALLTGAATSTVTGITTGVGKAVEVGTQLANGNVSGAASTYANAVYETSGAKNLVETTGNALNGDANAIGKTVVNVVAAVVTRKVAGGSNTKTNSGSSSSSKVSTNPSSTSSRSQPKQSGIANSSEIQSRNSNGTVTKYTEFDKSGNFAKEFRAGDGTTTHGINGPTVKTPNVNTNPKTGETFNNGFSVEPAKTIETPNGG